MIPDHSELGTYDAETWRAVPADTNPTGNEGGAWAVVAGDGEEFDVYLEVTAEYPHRVAQFVAAAVQAEAVRRRFDGAMDDLAAMRTRQHSETDNRPHMADTVRLALLIGHLGNVGRDISHRPDDRQEAEKRLYADLTQAGTEIVAWMEALLARNQSTT
jgi:hypothetical protein